MEIVGIGTEIVECVRIGRMIHEHGELFLARVFTPAEVRYCQDHKNTTELFASQWAGKEAILKALGVHSTKKLALSDMEIERVAERPKVCLSGAIKELAQQQNVGDILVTLAHCRTHGVGYALALKA